MSVQTPEPVEYYDSIILSPVIRAYYGGDEFYNVGLWSTGPENQGAASTALVDRLLSAVDAPCDVLDVGCGLGASTNQIVRRWPGVRVMGINISAHQIAHCQQAVPSAQFQVMDAAKLEFPENSFDLVVCVEAAFHFNTRSDFLRQARRVLRPGGTIALADILFVDGPMAQAVTVWDVLAANQVASLEDYAANLEALGFTGCRVDDVTAASWLAWCSALERWLKDCRDHSTVTAEFLSNWQASLPQLRQAVKYYLTATAIKSGNS